jgi:Tfp pilus assembly protein PilF
MINPLRHASIWLGLPSSNQATGSGSLTLLLLMLIPASPGLGQILVGRGIGQGTVRVIGSIRTDGGQLPQAGVMVRIETEDGQLVVMGPATSDGAFAFESVAKLVCKLIVKAVGFETGEKYLDLTRTANIYQVTINLTPSRKIESLVPPPALSDAKATKSAQKEFARGESALDAKNLDAAKTHLEKAVKDSPCYARAQTELAMVLAEKHEMADAEAAARKARECDPDFVDAYMQLGMILNTEGKFSAGEAALQEGIRRAPADWQFYYQLATAHYGQKDFTKAEQDYQRVLSLNPSPPAEFRVKLADVYLKENNYEKAYAQMQEYLKAHPDGPFALKIKNIMQQMEAAGAVKKGTS